MMVSETYLGMRISNELKKHIAAFAAEHEISMSGLIRWAVIDYIQNELSRRSEKRLSI